MADFETEKNYRDSILADIGGQDHGESELYWEYKYLLKIEFKEENPFKYNKKKGCYKPRKKFRKYFQSPYIKTEYFFWACHHYLYINKPEMPEECFWIREDPEDEDFSILEDIMSESYFPHLEQFFWETFYKEFTA